MTVHEKLKVFWHKIQWHRVEKLYGVSRIVPFNREVMHCLTCHRILAGMFWATPQKWWESKKHWLKRPCSGKFDLNGKDI